MRMKTRFMKVFRLFRLKKYGEPIGPPLPQRSINQESPSKVDTSKLLNVVDEEDHDSDDNDEAREVIP